MGNSATVTLSTGSWTCPPGYRGPVMISAFSAPVGIGGVYCSRLSLVEPGQTYAIVTGSGNFGTESLSNGNHCQDMSIEWWPGVAAHQVFTSNGTWVSPPGNSGPVLFYSSLTGSSSGMNSFGGVPISYIDGLADGTVTPVHIGEVAANKSYEVTCTTGSLIVAWFP